MAPPPPRRWLGEEHSVSPVVGTILILGITVAGIGAILVWGAPAIARIQAQSAQLAMQGEFEDLRASAQELSVPDHSRFPSVVLNDGTLSIEPGSRIMVTVNHDDAAHKSCDFRITAWADTAAKTQFQAAAEPAGSCSVPVSDTTLKASTVTGSNVVAKTLTWDGATATATLDDATADLSVGNWLFELIDPLDSTITYAEAWLISTDRVTWAIHSAQDRSVHLDAGSVFTTSDGTIFLDKETALGDSAFGPGYVGLWLRTLDAASYNAVSGRGTYEVYLALMGNYLRIDEQQVYKARYDIEGDLSEAWCNSLLLRNRDLAGSPYTEDAGTLDDCQTPDVDAVRSVAFCKPTCAAPVADITAFEYRMLEAQIYASLVT